MADIELRGYLVDNDNADVLRFFGWRDIVAPMDIRAALQEADGEDVTLLVNSGGGVLSVGSEIFSMLRRYPGRTEALVQSIAGSAATLPTLACGRILCEPGALLCYHNPRYDAEGDYLAHQHAAEELKNAAEAIVNVYMTRTGKSREEIQALMDQDLLISPQQAMEYGLVDEIVGLPEAEPAPVKLVASRMGGLPHVTAQMRRTYQEHLSARRTEEQTRVERARARLRALANF